jgi:hypothetical protein
MFHTDRDEEAAKADGVRQASILMQGCMCTYCSNQNVSLTQHPSDFPASVIDQYEIFGLTRLFHTNSLRGATNHNGVRHVMKSNDIFVCTHYLRKTSSWGTSSTLASQSSRVIGMKYAGYPFPQQSLNFFSLPQGQGSLRPTLGRSRWIGRWKVCSSSSWWEGWGAGCFCSWVFWWMRC